ncbi:zinc finger CCHC domain-containing protein 8 [Hypomesus transpacificus]|uniref:zinc finger CCHC domain-containing protein 8 n=1 Tax=Hypomesus transpacificus TaxID=137520 RepID=UPI001F0816C1|nr:zinc finger CCHC domain-containing protein 8 [Hypomesus transpacificus]
MAEVDFGDSELFQQLDDSMPVSSHIRFTDQETDQEDTPKFKEKLGGCEETNQRLIEENQDLKRKLRTLTRPSGLLVDNIKTDGPLLQILFANNSISKQCRQEVEDCVCSVIQKHQQQAIEKSSSYNVSPQASSFVMEEDHTFKTPCSIKTVTEAFSMVGSVLYFTTFCLDKLGQPLLNENPQQTDGWIVPTYQQVFNQVIAVDGQEVQIKERRSKPSCFNCGLTDHQLRDCPMPKDMTRINEKRKEFSQGNNQISGNQRYHAEEVEERFAKYKPGILSEDLLNALGVNMNTLPPFIYRMRQLGYPPGWLKEAETETSGLTLYDGNVSSDGDLTEENDGHRISYDVSKLVDFPGFNVSTSPTVKDDYRLYGSVPMQPNHLKENYAAYLSSSFPTTDSNCNKRRHEFESTPRQTKKRRSNSDSHGSDMDVDSDYSSPRHHRSSDGFQFQPPLPPGSPSFGSPPPLPQSTPPATPTPPPLPKGTPPLTPTNGSPALRGRAWGSGEEAGAGAGAGEEDALTLEELEEQQRLIWAALENADTATNSDSETPASGTPASGTPASGTPASGTPVPSSPSISTPVHVDTETEMEEGDTEEEQGAVELPGGSQEDEDGDGATVLAVKPSELLMAQDSPQIPEQMRVLEDSPESPAPKQAQEESPESPAPKQAQEESPESLVPMQAQEESPESPVPMQAQEESPLSPPSIKVQIRSLSPESCQGAVESELSESTGKVSAVPHRSKFAEGIIPFEDTPEYTEVAEATGTYLRIKDLLKGSPRNQSKNKK